jgi:XTP/dITP diphosphohydrolase
MTLKKIIFATNNAHKLDEVRHFLNQQYEILSLKEMGFDQDIDEPYFTLHENASVKSQTIYNHFGLDCFADDTGLEVEALNGEPGVFSARYAGPGCTFQDNVVKLLNEMKGKANRNARFRTVISLIVNGQEYHFEGQVDGHIAHETAGNEGFGYDPVFIPNGYSKSFAQMPLDEKNQISHRARAVAKLVEFLKQTK